MPDVNSLRLQMVKAVSAEAEPDNHLLQYLKLKRWVDAGEIVVVLTKSLPEEQHEGLIAYFTDYGFVMLLLDGKTRVDLKFDELWLAWAPNDKTEGAI